MVDTSVQINERSERTEPAEGHGRGEKMKNCLSQSVSIEVFASQRFLALGSHRVNSIKVYLTLR